MPFWVFVSVQFVLVINFNLHFLQLFVAVWQSIYTSAKVDFEIKNGKVFVRSLASCGDDHDGTSVMEKVSDIVSQYPALRSLKNVSKTMSSGLDGVQTLTVTVDLLARGKNTDEMALNQFLKTKLEENRVESPSCFTLQFIAVVTRDDPASMIESNKK